MVKRVSPWGYTCIFCSKKFESAQSLGGHQNAHRNQRRHENSPFNRRLRPIKSDKIVKPLPPKPIILQGIINFFPPKELSLAERVGAYANDVKENSCIGQNDGGYGINSVMNLDLALKL